MTTTADLANGLTPAVLSYRRARKARKVTFAGLFAAPFIAPMLLGLGHPGLFLAALTAGMACAFAAGILTRRMTNLRTTHRPRPRTGNTIDDHLS
jgi:hypothetical protein